MFRTVISQRAATVTSPAWLAYGLLGVSFYSFFISFFYSASNLSRYSSDLRHFFTETRVVSQGLKTSRPISDILVTCFTECKKTAKNALFNVFFTG